MYTQSFNGRYPSDGSSQFYTNEISKDNSYLTQEISSQKKQIIDKSLKELERGIKEMSDNLLKLNNETNEFIHNKNNNLKYFRSNSINSRKVLPNQGDIQNKMKNFQNKSNKKILNEYACNNNNMNNNLKSTQNYFLKNYGNDFNSLGSFNIRKIDTFKY